MRFDELATLILIGSALLSVFLLHSKNSTEYEDGTWGAFLERRRCTWRNQGMAILLSTITTVAVLTRLHTTYFNDAILFLVAGFLVALGWLIILLRRPPCPMCKKPLNSMSSFFIGSPWPRPWDSTDKCPRCGLLFREKVSNR